MQIYKKYKPNVLYYDPQGLNQCGRPDFQGYILRSATLLFDILFNFFLNFGLS